MTTATKTAEKLQAAIAAVDSSFAFGREVSMAWKRAALMPAEVMGWAVSEAVREMCRQTEIKLAAFFVGEMHPGTLAKAGAALRAAESAAYFQTEGEGGHAAHRAAYLAADLRKRIENALEA